MKPKEFLNLKQIFRQSLPKKSFPKIRFQVQQEIRESIVVGVIFFKNLCVFFFVLFFGFCLFVLAKPCGWLVGPRYPDQGSNPAVTVPSPNQRPSRELPKSMCFIISTINSGTPR